MAGNRDAEPERLPPILKALLELVARYMRMGDGNWTLQVAFSNGTLRDYRKHEGPVPPAALADYDEPG